MGVERRPGGVVMLCSVYDGDLQHSDGKKMKQKLK